MKAEPIVMERVYNATPSKVWKALTDAKDMKEWYFDLGEFRAEPGFKFHFYEPGGKNKFLHNCEVTAVVPMKKLTYSWSYSQLDPAITYVTFELFPEGNGTRLRLTHEGLERFDQSNKDLDKGNFVKGWTEIIGTNLKEFVEK
jgi:uncharacterized protein YndB with AHSA1/START domain